MIPQRAGVSEVRRNNLELVLRHLGTIGSASRADIAASTGLTRATVSRLVGDLIDLGLVRETGRTTSGPGRPGTALEIDGRHVLVIGAELTINSITVVIRDLSGNELLRRRRVLDAMGLGPEVSVQRLARLCAHSLNDVVAAERTAMRLAGVGVAVPGVVDEARNVVVDAPNLGWRDLPLGQMVAKALGRPDVPIVVDNDANFAAIAEYGVGPHAGTPNLVVIVSEIGVGGGILVGGRPIPGSGGRAGEVGHMCVDPNGPACGCGRRGCWEAVIGLNAFLRQFGDDGSPLRSEARIRPIVERARAGERKVLQALDQLGTWVGLGAANLVNVLSPEVIIFGGYLPYFGEWVLPTISRVVRERVMAPSSDADHMVAMSTLTFCASALGAAEYVTDRVLSNPAELAGAAELDTGISDGVGSVGVE